MVNKDLSLPIFNSSVTYLFLSYVGKFDLKCDSISNKIIWNKDLVITEKLEVTFKLMNVTFIF